MTGAVPPKPASPPRTTRNAWLIAALLVCAAPLLYFYNPSTSVFYPRCYFHALTGWSCPGCGALRATHQLLHGHLLNAFWLNPLYILALPFAFWSWYPRPPYAPVSESKL